MGWCGEFHPKVLRNYDIHNIPACYGFELNIALMQKASLNTSPVVKRTITVPKFPPFSRDFALLIPDALAAADIVHTVKNTLIPLLVGELEAHISRIHIFDVYKGSNIPSDKKSITFRVELEPLQRTLTEKDITLISDSVIQSVQKNLCGDLR
jgi:phenylalanyl-tRNA synthetase beta chain